jgi:hypothetical protein
MLVTLKSPLALRMPFGAGTLLPVVKSFAVVQKTVLWPQPSKLSNPTSTETINQLKNVNTNLENILKMGLLNNQLEQMVLDEAKQDWDWKTGIPAQINFIKAQAELDFVDL